MRRVGGARRPGFRSEHGHHAHLRERAVSAESRGENRVPSEIFPEHAGRSAGTDIHHEPGGGIGEIDEVVVPVARDEKHGGEVIADEHEGLGHVQGGHHRAAHGFHIEAPRAGGAQSVGDIEPGEPAGIILVLGSAPDHEIEFRGRDARIREGFEGSPVAHFGGGILRAGHGLRFDAEFFRDDVFGNRSRGGQLRGAHSAGRKPYSDARYANMHVDLRNK